VSQTEIIDLGNPLGPPKNLTKPNENKASEEHANNQKNKQINPRNQNLLGNTEM